MTQQKLLWVRCGSFDKDCVKTCRSWNSPVMKTRLGAVKNRSMTSCHECVRESVCADSDKTKRHFGLLRVGANGLVPKRLVLRSRVTLDRILRTMHDCGPKIVKFSILIFRYLLYLKKISDATNSYYSNLYILSYVPTLFVTNTDVVLLLILILM